MPHNEFSQPLIDHDSFERLQLQAKLQRANFMRNNAGLAFLTAGSIGLACVIAMVLVPETTASRQSTLETVAASQSTKQQSKQPRRLRNSQLLWNTRRLSSRLQPKRFRSLSGNQASTATRSLAGPTLNDAITALDQNCETSSQRNLFLTNLQSTVTRRSFIALSN